MALCPRAVWTKAGRRQTWASAMPLNDPEEFEQALYDALGHLYDPDYEAPPALRAALGCAPNCSTLDVQGALVRAIEDAGPPSGLPAGSRAQITHDVLRSRYVLRLTQEETSERLHVSVTSVWRMQREAIHALALTLRGASKSGPSPGEGVAADAGPMGRQADWRSQTREELAALRAGDPDSVANVQYVIEGAVEVLSPWMQERDIRVHIAAVQEDLRAEVHPTVLRQVLITSLRTLGQHAKPGAISLYAGLADGDVSISLSAPVGAVGEAAFEDLSDWPLAPTAIRLHASVDAGAAFLALSAPAVGTCTVLVVDDNPDTVRFYRRATEGTPYRIVPADPVGGAVEHVLRTKPDVIVLDVMLPDVDGWELLMRLHQHPATSGIPVVLCSVVREEELAISLGACLFLSKPVSPGEFVAALRAATGMAKGPQPSH